jgi:hypothetical protein
VTSIIVCESRCYGEKNSDFYSHMLLHYSFLSVHSALVAKY